MSKPTDQPTGPNSSLDAVVEEIRSHCPPGSQVTFISGNFNIVHPGHLRLFNFAAERGDVLIVGVNTDRAGIIYVKQDLRLESVRSIGVVDYAFVLEHPVEDLIAKLQPDCVVKGREHAGEDNPEQAIINSYGGKLLFSSGDVRFSSLDLLHQEFMTSMHPTIVKVLDFPDRHNFTFAKLEDYIGQMRSLNVVVIGDLIVDRYITCEALGMSQEDPTIVVTPLAEETFVGGAGIVAAHTRRLGAQTSFICVSGDDEIGQFARDKLEEYGVESHLFEDETRSTILKRRFRADGKTLLRVNEFQQNEISSKISEAILARLDSIIDKADLLIFSDFNYGCLPQPLVDEIIRRCQARNLRLFADSQVSSQTGDISRFKGMNLITPTELEARTACRDFSSGLVVLTSKLQARAQTPNVIMTLGSEGMLIQMAQSAKEPVLTDRLPAFNSLPAGVSGAGDSLLACAALCMTLGASIWETAYLGSIASACQVARVGNIPLDPEELIAELRK